MKILQHAKGYHTSLGGIERVVEELVPELARYPDLEVDVLCQGPEHRQADLPGRGRIYQERATLAISAAALSVGDYRTWRAIASRYDAIHVHAPWPQSSLNLLLSRFDGAVIVHWHSDIVRQRLLYRGYRWLERRMLERADMILATSPKLLEESTALEGFRQKARAAPIGIAESREQFAENEIAAARAKIGGRGIVFTLGRLVPYKGFEYLVRAAASLAPDARVLIGGEGPLRGELEHLIRRSGVEDRVALLGRLTDREVELHMRACDVFCLPSVQKSEAFGIVQIEAMRAGRPVVSTRITGSGIDWVNEDGVSGFTVEAGRPDALANALNRLLQDPGLARRMGEQGRRRYEAMFTARRMAEQVRAAYLSLRI
ncbi:MAG TPA: glycosyltransferase [Burkholderiales bacterium]|nr:glycosyltransferase [Burkholderiales bacterium]